MQFFIIQTMSGYSIPIRSELVHPLAQKLSEQKCVCVMTMSVCYLFISKIAADSACLLFDLLFYIPIPKSLSLSGYHIACCLVAVQFHPFSKLFLTDTGGICRIDRDQLYISSETGILKSHPVTRMIQRVQHPVIRLSFLS